MCGSKKPAGEGFVVFMDAIIVHIADVKTAGATRVKADRIMGSGSGLDFL
jgi:hypothetical protein